MVNVRGRSVSADCKFVIPNYKNRSQKRRRALQMARDELTQAVIKSR